jgi:hypothetical protein
MLFSSLLDVGYCICHSLSIILEVPKAEIATGTQKPMHFSHANLLIRFVLVRTQHALTSVLFPFILLQLSRHIHHFAVLRKLPFRLFRR